MPQAGLFDVADPTAPVRDRVLPGPTGTIARASAGAQRYPVNDGKGRTVAITSRPFCNPATCNSAEPQLIADFLGTLIHGDEISLLTVQLLTDGEIRGRCGLGAGACYFSGADTMLINGNDRTGPDGASRDFVIAHEYGHHVAEHRRNPPFQPTIFWGTKRWATYERVCQGTRAGPLLPGRRRAPLLPESRRGLRRGLRLQPLPPGAGGLGLERAAATHPGGFSEPAPGHPCRPGRAGPGS